MDPFVLIKDRLKREADASSSAHCDSLMNSCEFIIRHLTSTLIGLLPKSESTESLRYRAEFELLRTSGIGDWSKHLKELIVGQNFLILSPELNNSGLEGALEEITRVAPGDSDDWRADVVNSLRKALEYLEETPNQGKNVNLLEFFTEFPRLRNKMDAHGAPTSANKDHIASLLEPCVRLLLDQLRILKLPLVRVDFTSSNRAPRIIDVVGLSSSEDRDIIADVLVQNEGVSGIYVRGATGVREVSLIRSTPELQDYFYANGNFNDKKATAEFLSYVTNTRINQDCKQWSSKPLSPPPSSTAGMSSVRVEGWSITNYPTGTMSGYINRPNLEAELSDALQTPHRRIVTLKGMGGIGKTTLALDAVQKACQDHWFDLVVWMSSRDIDLTESGAIQVRPDVQTFDDLGRVGMGLFRQFGALEEPNPSIWMKQMFGSNQNGSVLWILDNFESMKDPILVYSQIDKCLTPPNKVLITTRHRDFVGDFPIEVRGLERAEFKQLVSGFSSRFHLELPESKIDQIYKESAGHPLIVNMMLSLYKANAHSSTRAVFSTDGLLDDLFERTYTRFTDDTQQVFLLLCSWNSRVQETALILAVNQGEGEFVDIDRCVTELVESSLLSVERMDDDYILQVPAVAHAFGQRKLKTHDYRTAILARSEILQLFGSISESARDRPNVGNDYFPDLVENLWRNLLPKFSNVDETDKYMNLARMAARTKPILWKKLGDYYSQHGKIEESINAYKYYVEADLGGEFEWKLIAQLNERLYRDMEALTAWVMRAMCEDATTDDISHAANKINGWVSQKRVTLTDAEKRVLIVPLIPVFERRLNECDADDCSRLAHLYRQIGNDKMALKIAERGLEIDPDNAHCQRLVWRN